MHIYQAARKALQELGKPTHQTQLREYIEAKGYYSFGAESPDSALAIEISRRSVGVEIGRSLPDKLFYRDSPATYGLTEWLDDAKTQVTAIAEQRVDAEITAILRSDSATTSKEALILARIGQGGFRSEVLALWENRCAVTGATLALRASHIKPWRDCDNFERLDPNNGLPLVATLDSLFDANLISFDIDGRILLAGTLTEREQKCLSIDGEMRLRRKPSTETESYLKEHRVCLGT